MKIRITFASILISAGAAFARAQSADAPHAAWYARLGLERSTLTTDQTRRMDAFAAQLESAPDPEAILADVDRRELESERRAPDAAGPDGSVWLQETSGGWRLTDAGLKAVPGILLKNSAASAPATTVGTPAKTPDITVPAARIAAALAAAANPGVFDGPLPSSYNGTLRGPSLAADDAHILQPGRSSVAFEYEANNNLLNESAGSNMLLYKAETHSYSLDYRRGLRVPRPLEVGVSAGIYQQGEGYLNGFINAAEHGLADIFGPEMINAYRSGPSAMKGTVEDIDVDGTHHQSNGLYGPRLGDVTFIAKTALAQIPGVTLAESLAATIATGGPFSKASSIGAGLSAQKTLSPKTSAFADVRAVMPVSSHDRDGLALNRRPALDATVGIEHRLAPSTTLTAQVDFAGSPYARTGLPAYDDNYTDLTVGLSRKLVHGLVATLSASEDFNTGRRNPGQGVMAPYGPPDFGVSLKLKKSF